MHWIYSQYEKGIRLKDRFLLHKTHMSFITILSQERSEVVFTDPILIKINRPAVYS